MYFFVNKFARIGKFLYRCGKLKNDDTLVNNHRGNYLDDYLNRQNVSNTFIDDVIAESNKLAISSKCIYNKKIEIAKNEYCEPTVYIELEKPVLIFAINTSDRAKETLINLMMLKENNMKYRTIAVIDEDAQITEKDKSRLINRASRPIIGLSDFRETIDEYLVG